MERFAKVNELLAEYESLEAQMADPAIHNRMPVILPSQLWDTWLNPDQLSKSEVADYLHMIDLPKPDEQLRFWPVTEEVNNARNSGPALAHPIALPESETLF